MSLAQCALCNIEITEQNDSEEHIIPNAIGGRKKVMGFICRSCNNKSGSEWDSDLSEQLNPFSLFLGISRQRGNVPSQIFETTSGEKVQIHPDEKMNYARPQYSEDKIENQVKINIQARSTSEAKRMLQGTKRKYPEIDLNETQFDIEEQESYLSGMIKFSLTLGGPKAGRSIVKSAMALAVKSGINPKDCEHAREYLLCDHGEACFGYYYEKDLLINRPDGMPLHCMFVRGDPNTRQLLGYAEFFGFQRIVMCLSSKYNGKEFTNCYAIDPINGAELDLIVNLSLTPEDIRASYNYEKYDINLYKNAIEKIISRAVQASSEKERNRVIDQAVKHAFLNCGAKEGEMLLPEHTNRIANLIFEKLKPFLLHELSGIREEK